MTAPLPPERVTELTEALHADMDGDFLIAASGFGEDIALKQAGVADAVRWAVNATAPLVARWQAEDLAKFRKHALLTDANLRALHENAKAYSLAVQALNKVRGGALSTTLAWLIEQGYLVPADPRAGERNE